MHGDLAGSVYSFLNPSRSDPGGSRNPAFFSKYRGLFQQIRNEPVLAQIVILDTPMSQETNNAHSVEKESELARPTLAVVPRAEDYMALVHKTAWKEYRRAPSSLEVEDLVAAGTIALLEALNNFDAERAELFPAYAMCRIRGAMIDEIRSASPLSRGALKKYRRIAEAEQDFLEEFGRVPNSQELQTLLGVSVEEYSLMLQDVQKPVHVSLGDAQGEGEPLDIEDPSSFDVVEAIDLQQRLALLEGALLELSGREREIIEATFLRGTSLKQVGKSLGVTESRVCQIRKRATGRLATIMSAMVANER